MQPTRRLLIIAGAVTALVAGGTGTAIALSGGDDDGDAQATGADAERARAAALEVTKGGTAEAVERDSENGAVWEVEVTRRDGTTVEVRLDEQYKLVVVESESEQGEIDD